MTGERSEAVTLAVLESKVDGQSADIRDLTAAIREQAAASVPRTEWAMRNDAVDRTTNGLGREIGELRTELRSRRVSWPAVAAVTVSAAALLLQLIAALSRSP